MWVITEKQLDAIADSISKITERIITKGTESKGQEKVKKSKQKKKGTSAADTSETAETSETTVSSGTIESSNNTDNSTQTVSSDDSSATPTTVLPCEAVEVISLSVDTVTTAADPKILQAKWKNKSKEDIDILEHDDTPYVEIKTQGFKDNDELTVEIKEDVENGETFKTLTLKLKNNEISTDDNALKVEDSWHGKLLAIHVSTDKVEKTFIGSKVSVKCCKHCITKDAESDLIKEMNIRLAGFGERGTPLPEKKFTKETENAVKQFQRDYMEVNPTGIVCKHFLEKLDEFCSNYYIKIETDSSFGLKCPCVNTKNATEDHYCSTGFGKGLTTALSYTHKWTVKEKVKEKDENGKEKEDGKETEQDVTKELKVSYGGEEKPGVHRSLLWAVSAMKFYLEKVESGKNLKIGKFHSVYRCKGDNINKFDNVKKKARTTTNHMGNAIDMHIYKDGGSTTTTENCDSVRELYAIYSGANIRWKKDGLNLEPSVESYLSEFIATNWVHIDCRDFSSTYQKNEFYCQAETALKGTSFIDGKLVETSDSGKYKDVTGCTYNAKSLGKRKRKEILWLGIIKDVYSLKFTEGKDGEESKWEVENTTLPSKTQGNTKLRLGGIVEILEGDNTRYKIKPRIPKGEGWIEKIYVKELYKHEVDT